MHFPCADLQRTAANQSMTTVYTDRLQNSIINSQIQCLTIWIVIYTWILKLPLDAFKPIGRKTKWQDICLCRLKVQSCQKKFSARKSNGKLETNLTVRIYKQ